MMYFRLLWTVVLCAGPVVAGLAQPGGESASKVTRTIRGDTLAPGERGRVSIRARIADGWTMYAPDSPPPTIGAAVAVGAETSEAISVDRPAHTTTTPASGPHFDRTVRFFAGPARLWLPVALAPQAPSGPHAVEGTLQFMGCSDEICLPPTATTISVSVWRANRP